jgi:hypothetical protein
VKRINLIALALAACTTITGQQPDKNTIRAMIAKGEVIEIPANSDQAFVIGRLPAGSVIYLQYIAGVWKSWGQIATANPDDPKDLGGDKKGGKRNRLAIAEVLASGGQRVLAVVPPNTLTEPFCHLINREVEKTVLRINAAGNVLPTNPGKVKYRFYVQTPTAVVNVPAPAPGSSTDNPLPTGTSLAARLIAAAAARYNQSLADASRQYLADLDAALQAVMRTGNLDDANVIRDAIRDIKDSKPVESPFTNALANTAKKRYEQTATVVVQQYIRDLDTAQKAAMDARNLDEANAIGATRKKLERWKR